MRTSMTRREALQLLGVTVGTMTAGPPLNAQQQFTTAEPPDFPPNSIIRTLQGDVVPSSLDNGATHFTNTSVGMTLNLRSKNYVPAHLTDSDALLTRRLDARLNNKFET